MNCESLSEYFTLNKTSLKMVSGKYKKPQNIEKFS